MANKRNTRADAARLSLLVVDGGHSIDAVLANHFATINDPQERGFTQELVYGVCRWYGDLDQISRSLLNKPIRNKDRVIHFLLLVGLYQLRHLQTAPHAAVSETVGACQQLQKGWAKNLINGCLRSYQRDPEQLETAINKHLHAHPQWLVSQLQNAWPEHAVDILQSNNQRPPMCLRVNQRRFTRADYLVKLTEVEISGNADPYSDSGIILDQAVAVDRLPGFAQGAVSVQDTAAQLAAFILKPQRGQRILDACAAPGGKAAHLLEYTDNQLHLDALDISAKRCLSLHETMTRLQLSANIYAADATQTNSWPHPEAGYDRILIDAPCSGTGVIRRHPDIKHHRQASDIAELRNTQAALLTSLWPLLKPDGLLLYMTCSVLPAENEGQAAGFLQATANAVAVPFTHPCALPLEHGYQTLPGIHQMDGFYYCLLRKMAA